LDNPRDIQNKLISENVGDLSISDIKIFWYSSEYLDKVSDTNHPYNNLRQNIKKKTVVFFVQKWSLNYKFSD